MGRITGPMKSGKTLLPLNLAKIAKRARAQAQAECRDRGICKTRGCGGFPLYQGYCRECLKEENEE